MLIKKTLIFGVGELRRRLLRCDGGKTKKKSNITYKGFPFCVKVDSLNDVRNDSRRSMVRKGDFQFEIYRHISGSFFFFLFSLSGNAPPDPYVR